MLKRFGTRIQGNLIVLAGVIGFVAFFGAIILPTSAAHAESRDCHVFTPTTDWYDAGYVNTKQYTVPGSSECLDINVRNIKNSDPAIATSDADKYCATFKVVMYPSDKMKPIYYSSPKYVCSKDPSSSTKTNGPVMELATDVRNGTKYRVLSYVTTPGKAITYQIVD